ncbi:family 5 glycoside hydrolase [Tribonema minus]|uniref:Family 5 glycoside hydrolase n=1 Tax=Tribonema minus TaxID=303371 RepID=A0A835Z2K8_9STRA|nr:family 5 glycoside hydrolase [Tribonema minus]
MFASDLQKLGVGFNLGNRFDSRTNSIDFDTSVKRAISDFKAKGFTHVRIPVTWMYKGKCKLKSDPYFVQQLTKAVKYAVSLKLFVIVDTHHESWLKDHFDGSATLKATFEQLWTDISHLFADISDDALIFQVLNEPPSNFDIAKTRLVNQWGYDAIRAVTTTRCILCMGNDMGSPFGAKAVYPTAADLPGAGKDARLALSVHTYGPPEFALQDGSNDVFATVAEVTASIDKRFSQLKKWIARSGHVTMVWDEFGVGARNDQARRGDPRVREFYHRTANLCSMEKWPCTVWCDQSWFGVRHESGEFVYGLADAVLQGKADADKSHATAAQHVRR